MADPKTSASVPKVTERFRRLTNIQIEWDESGYGEQFRLPGFKYDDFDRSGCVTVEKLLKCMDTARFLSHRYSAGSSLLVVGLTMDLDISPTLYDRAAVCLPLTITRRLIHVGRTSLTYEQYIIVDEDQAEVSDQKGQDDVPQEMERADRFLSTEEVNSHERCTKQQKILAYRQYTVVNVDLFGDGKPRPIPAGHFPPAGYSSPSVISVSRRRLQTVAQLPARHFKCHAVVRDSDTDLYMHVTQPVYAVYASECATQACGAGFYRICSPAQSCDSSERKTLSEGHGKDIQSVVDDDRNVGGSARTSGTGTPVASVMPLVKSARFLHMGEARAGDRLVIYSWDDDTNPYVVRFVICKGDEETGGAMLDRSKVLCHVEYEYFPRELAGRL